MIGEGSTVHRFTREKLYDLVWSESMSKLAARLGLSDRGLAKACARANVPVPGRGYWAKLQHGASVARSPLPPAVAGTPEIFEVRRGLRKSDLPPLPPEVVKEMAKESTPDRKIVVPRDLSRSHPIVRALLEARQGQTQHGAIAPYGVTLPRQRVTTSERRRMRILSALFKALEARGHKVVVDPEDHHHLAGMVGQDKVDFTLTFRQRQIRVPLSPQEQAEWLNAMTGRQFRQEQQVTDELVFRILSVWFPDPRVKKEWADKPNRPLEDRLNETVAGMIAAAAVQREHRISQEEEEAARHRREQELERQKRQEAEEAEARRFEELVRQVGRWRQADEIRAYVKVVKARARALRDRTSRTRLREWAAWALKHANRIDGVPFGQWSSVRVTQPIGVVKNWGDH
jgi:hypothetical protein